MVKRFPISHRIDYAVSASICILNIVGMFLVVFGAAAGAHVALLLWPGIALMAGGILLLAILSALRASQVGVSPWMTTIAVVLLCFAGPVVPVLVIYLVVREEKPGIAPAKGSPWMAWLGLLIAPWGILMGIKYLAGNS